MSIDGGGIRGLIPALVLEELERRAGRNATSMFDLVVGTSTGAIIGMGVAAGIAATDLAAFYPRYGDTIFGDGATRTGRRAQLLGDGSSLWQQMAKMGAPFGGNPRTGTTNARHRVEGLESVLRSVLGDTKLSQVSIELAVTTFDGLSNQAFVLTSREARRDPRSDLFLRDVARATSAAPTYFPPKELDYSGARRSFVDGGVWANNPTAVALCESIWLTSARGLTGDNVFLLSLGTGIDPAGSIFKEYDSWLGVGRGLMAQATTVGVGETLATLTLPPDRHRRIQVVDPRIAGAMDDCSPPRLKALSEAARQVIADQSDTLDWVVERLTA